MIVSDLTVLVWWSTWLSSVYRGTPCRDPGAQAGGEVPGQAVLEKNDKQRTSPPDEDTACKGWSFGLIRIRDRGDEFTPSSHTHISALPARAIGVAPRWKRYAILKTLFYQTRLLSLSIGPSFLILRSNTKLVSSEREKSQLPSHTSLDTPRGLSHLAQKCVREFQHQPASQYLFVCVISVDHAVSLHQYRVIPVLRVTLPLLRELPGNMVS